MAGLEKKVTAFQDENLSGRSQKLYFEVTEEENFTYYGNHEVDFNKRIEIDCEGIDGKELNQKIRNALVKGFGSVVIKNPGAKHALGVGILNKLNLIFEGSLGYFGVGCIDGPTVRVKGRVGWSCAENMMSGKVVVENNAGSCFGAALRGGDLIVKGDAGARTGIDMKGGTILIGGNAGAYTGFMMQRGRIIVCGNVSANMGDSMYDGIIFVGGEPKSLGTDCVEGEMNDHEIKWLEQKIRKC
jgi:glutamate synthase domain-containing protein 3